MVNNKPTKCSEVDFVEIIKYLNLKTRKRFTVTATYRKLMRARFAEGYEVKDFKAAIDNQLNDEYFKKNPKFYRPDTLFNGKFGSYVNNTPMAVGLAPGEMKEKPVEIKPDPLKDNQEMNQAMMDLAKYRFTDKKKASEAMATMDRLNKEAG